MALPPKLQLLLGHRDTIHLLPLSSPFGGYNRSMLMPVFGVSTSCVGSHNPAHVSVSNSFIRGTWVAQSVKHLTLDFGLGHDLTVCEFESHIRFWADSAEPA